MKKILVISPFLVALASLASATPMTCGVLMTGDSSVTVASNTCSVNPDPGFFISSLTLTANDDYTGLLFGHPDVSFAAILSQSAPVFTGATFCDVTTGPMGRTQCSATILPANTVTALNLSTFTIGLIDASNTVSGGSIIGASIVLDLDYGETRISSAATPEPTSFELIGVALLGVGFLAFKKKE